MQTITSESMAKSAYKTDQRIKYGQALVVIRGLLGITQLEAAEWLGLSIGTLRNAERNGTVTKATAERVELRTGRNFEETIKWYDTQRDWVLEKAKDDDLKGAG